MKIDSTIPKSSVSPTALTTTESTVERRQRSSYDDTSYVDTARWYPPRVYLLSQNA